MPGPLRKFEVSSLVLFSRFGVCHWPDDGSYPGKENGEKYANGDHYDVESDDVTPAGIAFAGQGRQRLYPEHVRYERVHCDQLEQEEHSSQHRHAVPAGEVVQNILKKKKKFTLLLW